MSGNDKGRERVPGELSPEERAAFERRLSELGDKVSEAKAADAARRGPDESAAQRGRGMAYGLRMATELVSAIIVGGVIGYFLDRWLGTTPWLFLVFFLLGFAAGVLNVLRSYERLQREITSAPSHQSGRARLDDD